MSIPAGLGERGLALWQAMKSDDVARDALVLEAARLTDRLDELDSVIQGKGVLNLMQFRVLNREFEEHGEALSIDVEVKFQNVLSEARQQQLALANVMGKLGLKATDAGAADQSAEPKQAAATPDDMLAARRAGREAAG